MILFKSKYIDDSIDWTAQEFNLPIIENVSYASLLEIFSRDKTRMCGYYPELGQLWVNEIEDLKSVLAKNPIHFEDKHIPKKIKHEHEKFARVAENSKEEKDIKKLNEARNHFYGCVHAYFQSLFTPEWSQIESRAFDKVLSGFVIVQLTMRCKLLFAGLNKYDMAKEFGVAIVDKVIEETMEDGSFDGDNAYPQSFVAHRKDKRFIHFFLAHDDEEYEVYLAPEIAYCLFGTSKCEKLDQIFRRLQSLK
jgi:hypothetical protein